MKIYKEVEVVDLMIDIYYKKQIKLDKNKKVEKEDLKNYCHFRLSKCPFKDNKPFCSNCKIHCYDKIHQDLIKKVMRYSGPRMLIYHPLLAFRHLIESSKNKKMIKRKEKESSNNYGKK